MAFDKEKFITELKEMKVSELNDLVKSIEEEFGVSAAAPAAAAGEADSGSAEKDLVLVSTGTNKVAVIKVVREIMGLGLMEAKKFAEDGGVVKEALGADEHAELAAKFVEAGATVK